MVLNVPKSSFPIIFLLLPGVGAYAQSAGDRFEVASVRVSDPALAGAAQIPGRSFGGPGTSDPEHITYSRTSFQQLLVSAYGVQRDQIRGPDWVSTDDPRETTRYDLSAKVPPGTTKEQAAEMLQKLLADRFRRRLHHEIADLSGYALLIAKGGPKLLESTSAPNESERAQATVRGRVDMKDEKDGFPQLFVGRNMGGIFSNLIARLRFRDYMLKDLAQQLSFALDARVIDRTMLSGKYDFTLRFALPETAFTVGAKLTLPLAPGQTAPLSREGLTFSQQDAIPIISSAMQKQIGLRLEAAKVAVGVLVIDHVEKIPADN